MIVDGPRLFADRDFDDRLREFFAECMAEAYNDLPLKASKSRFRRTVIASASDYSVPCLGLPCDVTFSEDDENIRATCVVPFDGDAKAFDCDLGEWPEPRPLYGIVGEDAITLSAIAQPELSHWLPALLSSEIAAINARLDALAESAVEYRPRIVELADQVAEHFDPKERAKSAAHLARLRADYDRIERNTQAAIREMWRGGLSLDPPSTPSE